MFRWVMGYVEEGILCMYLAYALSLSQHVEPIIMRSIYIVRNVMHMPKT